MVFVESLKIVLFTLTQISEKILFRRHNQLSLYTCGFEIVLRVLLFYSEASRMCIRMCSSVKAEDITDNDKVKCKKKRRKYWMKEETPV